MESRTVALLLVVLVALAGCTGTADVTTTATTTESDAASTEPDATTTTERDAAATTAGTTLDPESADLPPGVNASGVENASRLLGAHRDALSESGYRFRVVSNTSRDRYNSRSVSRGTVTEHAASFRIRSESEARMANQTFQIDSDTWGNESVVLRRQQVGNRTHYQQDDASVNRSPGADAFASTRTANVARMVSQSQIVRFALRTGEYEVAGVEARNGTTLTTLRATGFNRSFRDGIFQNRSRYDSTLVVDERGRVHRLNTTLRAEQMSTSYDFEIAEFGDVSVAYPEWADQALATVNARIEVDSGDGYFTVSNEAGDALPAGSEIRASHDGVNATLELDDSLAPGEQVYVYFPEDGEKAVLATDPPEENATTELRGEYEFEVVDPTGQSLLNAGFGFGSASAPATTGGDGNEASGEGTGVSDDGSGDSGHGSRSSGGEDGTTAAGETTTTATG